MTAENLEKLKKDLLVRISRGMGGVLKELKEILPTDSARFSEFIQLESRLQEANKSKVKGIISQAELQLYYNQIRDDLIEFIQSLKAADFFKSDRGSIAKARQGSLLYNIPDRMKVSEEAKCVIRLAYDEDVILENIELEPSVVLKTVRVTEVMQAELLDPAGEPAFTIRSLSTEEQFLEEGAYTEWIFYVTPIRAGTFPLLIKVSVVELIQGRERVREIVWEEQVEILTEGAKAVATSSDFRPSPFNIHFGEAGEAPPLIDEGQELEILDHRQIEPLPEKPKSPQVPTERVKRQTPHAIRGNRRPKRKNYLNPLLGLLLLVCVGYYALPALQKGGGSHYKPPPPPPPDSTKTIVNPIPTDSVLLQLDTIRE